MIDSYYAPIAYKVVHKDGLKLVGKEQIEEREFFKAEDIINMLEDRIKEIEQIYYNDEKPYYTALTELEHILKELKGE